MNLNNWKQIIDIIPEEELREFITDYATRNKKFRNKLIIEFDLTILFKNLFLFP